MNKGFFLLLKGFFLLLQHKTNAKETFAQEKTVFVAEHSTAKKKKVNHGKTSASVKHHQKKTERENFRVGSKKKLW